KHRWSEDRSDSLPRGRGAAPPPSGDGDRKSTRLNSSHEWISYAVFCLKKKKWESGISESSSGEWTGHTIRLKSRRIPSHGRTESAYEGPKLWGEIVFHRH